MIFSDMSFNNNFQPKIEMTADGSVTLYRSDIDEHYHSVKGALAESRHVYIELGWQEAALHKSSLRVFEVGYGTGLNATLTAAKSLNCQIPTKYYSVEKKPLSAEVTDNLTKFQPEEYSADFIKVNQAAWDKEVKINDYFTLVKINGDLLSMHLPDELDVVYFDAFAPEKQPEMWDEGIFRKIHSAMSPGGILTTYCAKGSIRRLLQQIGFLTERLPGPPGGKREVLRAIRMNQNGAGISKA